ncbi:type ISP restriction/modification enzyme [Alkalibacillus haloalkaliphilus]|uniref:type ISP restriction/modification enzyme n=1 Tax=Alkalibacillus haloalkaliphilus TaxID=94136 RepID=UPI000319B565
MRGAVRGRSGDDAKREGQSVFNILTGVAICILIKDGSNNHEIKYYDIGDYLSKKEKLDKITSFKSIKNIEWSNIIPDKNNDWLNQRDEKYLEFVPMDSVEEGIFNTKSLGVSTNRDTWVYGFSKEQVKKNVHIMIDNVNSEMDRLKGIEDKDEIVSKLNADPKFVSWSRGLKQLFLKGEKITLNPKELNVHVYRPFTKKWLYYDKNVVEMSRKFRKTFGENNKVIVVPGNGSRRNFSCLMVDAIPDLNILDAGAQGFSLYNKEMVSDLLEDDSNISTNASNSFGLSTDDIFYYTYAVLHSKDYREKYDNDLRKQLPRIPKLKNKEKYVDIGRKLAHLHLNYESVSPYDGVKIEGKKTPSYKVTKMKHPRRDMLDKIIFNEDITITNIPEKAYQYIINGRPAIEWVIDQYRVKKDKKSGIVDDPNDYSDDEKFILNLLLRVINVSVQTVDLIDELPQLEIDQ